MEKGNCNFLMCGGCSRKEVRSGMSEGEYYCRVIEGTIPNGKVRYDTDATACDWYTPINMS